jgi:hypothetical protein
MPAISDLQSDVSMNVATQFPGRRNYADEPCFRALFEEAAIGIAICRLAG